MFKFTRRITFYLGQKKNLRLEIQKTGSFLSNITKDRYEVDPHVIKQLGGSSFLELFDHRLDNMLTAFYPQIQWKPWLFKFQSVPNGFWSEKKNQVQDIRFLRKVEEFS